MMDIYVMGPFRPHNNQLGGKRLVYFTASHHLTLSRTREVADLVLLVTTSLFGARSSQYNRLTYQGEALYQLVGVTRGYGSMHISPRTFGLMRALLEANQIRLPNHFGAGPNWRLRVIRAACKLLGVDAELSLQHSFRRGIWAVPLADNFREYLLGEAQAPAYKNRPMEQLIEHWRERWRLPRIARLGVMDLVGAFDPRGFSVLRYDPLPEEVP